MSENRMIYVKFARDDAEASLGGFIIGGDEEKIKSWDPKKIIPNQAKKDIPSIPSELNFENLGFILVSRIDTFRHATPLIMSNMPRAVENEINSGLKSVLIKEGRLASISDGEETYEISAEKFPVLSHSLQSIRLLIEGINKAPDLFLIGLVSSYDAFVSDLMKCIMEKRPEILSGSEKNISFKDLIELGSIEAARKTLVDREVEGELRKSHIDQIKWIENKTNLKIRENNTLWGKFVEICERRNLFTHTEGVISQQYLNVCAQNSHQPTEKIGERLRVDPKYFSKSADLLMEFGIKLYQTVWRKIAPEELEIAEQVYDKICYDFLKKKDFSMSANLLRFALNDMKRFKQDALRRVSVINLAIAEKGLGFPDRAAEIIDKEDWSAVSDDYKICICAVKNQYEKFYDLMQKISISQAISADDFREWPAFAELRTTEQFQEKFREFFGEDLVIKSNAEIENFSFDEGEIEHTKEDQAVAK